MDSWEFGALISLTQVGALRERASTADVGNLGVGAFITDFLEDRGPDISRRCLERDKGTRHLAYHCYQRAFSAGHRDGRSENAIILRLGQSVKRNGSHFLPTCTSPSLSFKLPFCLRFQACQRSRQVLCCCHTAEQVCKMSDITS